MIINSQISRLAIVILSFSSLCIAQKDPGVRGGPPGAGGPIKGLKANELALFVEGLARTTQLEAVCDTCNDVTLGSDTGQDPGDFVDRGVGGRNRDQADKAAEIVDVLARRGFRVGGFQAGTAP